MCDLLLFPLPACRPTKCHHSNCSHNRPDKKDKEAAFAEFAASLDDQLKQQAAAEDDEAEEAAREREEREAYEQQ